ncbi:hypothetical protein SLA2020_084690 [Shorea laevis]
MIKDLDCEYRVVMCMRPHRICQRTTHRCSASKHRLEYQRSVAKSLQKAPSPPRPGTRASSRSTTSPPLRSLDSPYARTLQITMIDRKLQISRRSDTAEMEGSAGGVGEGREAENLGWEESRVFSLISQQISFSGF